MSDETLSTDLLHGAREIGDFIGVPERKIYYHVSQGHLPVTRLGDLIIASKTALRAHFQEKKSES
jgi:hypothetical protein